MFIEGYKIKSKTCDNLIKCFNQHSKFHKEGVMGQERLVDKNAKDSIDLETYHLNDNIDVVNYYMELNKCIEKYKTKYIHCDINQNKWGITESPIIQKYPPNGGFKTWHYENSGHLNSIKRHLVFMTYLNDVKDGGGTEFLYQKEKFKAKKGLTLIWPAEWTHTHKGIVSTKYEKYIITGWISYI